VLPAPPPGPDIFSRTIQASIGIGTGMVAFGAAMGALFAAVWLGQRLRERFGTWNAALLAGAAHATGLIFAPLADRLLAPGPASAELRAPSQPECDTLRFGAHFADRTSRRAGRR
jgi:hypothetical protein